jgi:glucokinase
VKHRYILGLDIGNTWIRACLANLKGKLLSWKKKAVQPSWDLDQSLDQCFGLMERVLSKCNPKVGEIKGIGISFGGLVDCEQGRAILSHNFPVWRDVPLCQLIEKRFKVPTVMDNDANLGALAEYTFGQMQGVKNFLYLTVSTGIGGGLMLKGELYRGSKGLAGEIGHTMVLENGPLCTCGKYGCLEALASGTSLARRAMEVIRQGNRRGEKLLSLSGGNRESITAKTLLRAARMGDPFALSLFHDAGKYLGIAIAQAVLLLDLEKVVIGGGVANAGKFLFNPIQETLNSLLFPEQKGSVKVIKSRLGDRSGLLGAIALAQRRIKSC